MQSASSKPSKHQALLDEDTRRSVDGWRRTRDPIPGFSQAVRELVHAALKEAVNG